MTDREKIYQLWKLLDDIDTLDDAARADDTKFRARTRAIQRKRFDVVDGPELEALYDDFHPSTDLMRFNRR